MASSVLTKSGPEMIDAFIVGQHDPDVVIAWHLFATGEIYTDLGGDYFDKRRNSTAYQKRLVAPCSPLTATMASETLRQKGLSSGHG